jgi:Domain of unknown function (DUF4124)
MKRVISLITLLVAFFPGGGVLAETYKCTNAKGKVNFTDKPCKNAQQTTLNSASGDTAAEPTADPAPNQTPVSYQAISIEEAYAAIPHKRTVFKPKESPLPVSNTFAF